MKHSIEKLMSTRMIAASWRKFLLCKGSILLFLLWVLLKFIFNFSKVTILLSPIKMMNYINRAAYQRKSSEQSWNDSHLARVFCSLIIPGCEVLVFHLEFFALCVRVYMCACVVICACAHNTLSGLVPQSW